MANRYLNLKHTMEKKAYIIPQTKVIHITISSILSASDPIHINLDDEVSPDGAESRYHVWDEYENFKNEEEF